jgi:AbrB family looped-hinge helix DNA binding protein
METTRLSSKGQIIIPKSLRDRRGWESGTAFEIEEHEDGLILRPLRDFPATTLDEVFGCLAWDGPPLTTEDMDAAVAREARRRSRR